MGITRFSLAALAAAALIYSTATSAATSDRPPTLVELYTSQGCSSCPPADAYAAELAKRDDVVVLTLHVDYWDYIGWKDRFASKATTDRQYRYVPSLGRGMVYTPQMVIDGVFDAVGSDKRAVARAIAKAQAAKRPRLDIGLSQADDGGLLVSVPGADFQGRATVWLARYDRRTETSVANGENAGRVLSTVNVVRDLRRVGSWDGRPLDLRLPESVLTSGEGGRDACVIIVQANGNGPVLGVRALMLDASAF